MAFNQDRLMEFLGRFVTDLGATVAAGNVVVGHRLGLYRALATEPATPAQLAERTGTDPRYVAEWLAGQAAGGYIRYDASTGSYSMTEEQAFALADPHRAEPAGAFVMALGTLRAEPRITEAFRTGAGVGWHEHAPGRLHRDRGVLPGRLRREPGVQLVAGPGRRRAPSSRPAGGSPTWAAGSARRRCCSPRPTRDRRVVGSDYHEASRSTWPASAPPTPAWPNRTSFEVGIGAELHRDRLRPGDRLRLPARHGRPGRAPPGTSGKPSPRTAPG